QRMIDGSRVYVHTALGTYMQQVPGTVIGGRCSQMTQTLHFGLGKANAIDSVVVFLPDGTRNVHRDVQLERTSLLLTNGTTTGLVIDAPRLVSPAQHAIGVSSTPTLEMSTSSQVEIQVSTTPDFSANVISVSGASSTATLPQPLANGTTYYWRARYEVGPAASPWSSVWQFTVGAPQPNGTDITKPLENEVVSNKTVVSWTRASYDSWQKPTVYYDVRILRMSDRVIVDGAYNIADTMFTFDLVAGEFYVAMVRAKSDTNAVPAWSEDRSFRTYRAAPSISLESPTNGASGQPIRPRLTWHKHEWVDKGYVVQYDVSNTFATATEKVRPDSVFPIISSLKPGTTYYWRVRGDNEAGEGAWSEVWSFTTTGTSSVEEHGTSIHDGTAERFIVYDVLGRVLLIGRVQDWDRLRSTLPSLPNLMMTIASNGDVVERFLLPTP
ncbi:MAG: hypothetical protein EHM43_05470, partial [Ignavibacteriae bacterium]